MNYLQNISVFYNFYNLIETVGPGMGNTHQPIKCPVSYQLRQEINETVSGVGNARVKNLKNEINRLKLRDQLEECLISIDEKFCHDRMLECLKESKERVDTVERNFKELESLSAAEGTDHLEKILKRQKEKSENILDDKEYNEILDTHLRLLQTTNKRIEILLMKNQEDLDVGHSVNMILQKRELSELLCELNPEEKLEYIIREQDKLRALNIRRFCHAVELKRLLRENAGEDDDVEKTLKKVDKLMIQSDKEYKRVEAQLKEVTDNLFGYMKDNNNTKPLPPSFHINIKETNAENEYVSIEKECQTDDFLDPLSTSKTVTDEEVYRTLKNYHNNNNNNNNKSKFIEKANTANQTSFENEVLVDEDDVNNDDNYENDKNGRNKNYNLLSKIFNDLPLTLKLKTRVLNTINYGNNNIREKLEELGGTISDDTSVEEIKELLEVCEDEIKNENNCFLECIEEIKRLIYQKTDIIMRNPNEKILDVKSISKVKTTVDDTVDGILFLLNEEEFLDFDFMMELFKEIKRLKKENKMLLNELNRLKYKYHYNSNQIPPPFDPQLTQSKPKQNTSTSSTTTTDNTQTSSSIVINHTSVNLPEAKEDTKNIQVPLDSVVSLLVEINEEKEEIEKEKEKEKEKTNRLIELAKPKNILKPTPPPPLQQQKQNNKLIGDNPPSNTRKQNMLFHKGAMALATDYAQKLHISQMRIDQLMKRIDVQNRVISSLKHELNKDDDYKPSLQIRGREINDYNIDDDMDDYDIDGNDTYNRDNSKINTPIFNPKPPLLPPQPPPSKVIAPRRQSKGWKRLSEVFRNGKLTGSVNKSIDSTSISTDNSNNNNNKRTSETTTTTVSSSMSDNGSTFSETSNNRTSTKLKPNEPPKTNKRIKKFKNRKIKLK